MIPNLATTHFGGNLLLHYQSKDTVIGGQIAQSGIYEPYEEALLLDLLKTGDSAVDVGANIGVYTLQMAKKVGDRGMIYAFEPEPDNFSILQTNIIDNKFNNVEIFPFALSNMEGGAKLYLSWDNMGDHRIYDGKYVRARNTIDIAVTTLDIALLHRNTDRGKISVIKIDTQGYEPFVIEGAKELIQKDHPAIFLEYWPIAYKKAHANTKWMIDFLLTEYKKAFIIDGFGKKLVPLQREHLDSFVGESGGDHAWRNLLFS